MKRLIQSLGLGSLLILMLMLAGPIQVSSFQSSEGEPGSFGGPPDIGVDECAPTQYLLAAVPRDGAIDLTWTEFEHPVLASYVITYTYGTGGSDAHQGPSPISNIPPTIQIYSLTGVTNYVFYTITTAARDGNDVDLAVSNSVRVMPTDIFLYLPVIIKATPNHCYYVAPYGDDNNPGTETQPWATVHKAATTATAGGTVIFKDGTYNMPGEESGWNSGTAGNLITFISDTRRGATWLRTGSAGNSMLNLQGVDYVTFKDLIIQGNQVYALSNHVYMTNSDHITFDDCEIFDGGAKGIYLQGTCTHITIRDCTIHPEEYDPQVGVRDGIEITSSGNQYINIINTEIYHTEHNGIAVTIGEDITITGCHIHDTGSHGIGLHAAVRCEISHCQIHDADPDDWGNGGAWHNGIRVTSYEAGEVGAEDITIYGNDIYTNQVAGIYVRQDAAGPVGIYNNTLYANNQHSNNNSNQRDAGQIRLDFYTSATNRNPVVRIKNNIIHVTQVARTCSFDAEFEANLDTDYNLYYSTSATEEIQRNGTIYTTFAAYKSAGYEPNTVIDDDPDFNNAANANFTLQACSPAIDQGVDIGEAYRGSAPDIGANEYTAASSPWPGYYNLRMAPVREQHVIAIAKRLGMEPEDGDVIWYTIKAR